MFALRALTRAALIAAIAAIPALTLPGCEDDAGDDLERVGEGLEESAEDAGRAVEDAFD